MSAVKNSVNLLRGPFMPAIMVRTKSDVGVVFGFGICDVV